MDQIYSQNVFAASLGMLPYSILSDWHKQTAKDYGVFNAEREIAIRSVFLVDKQGMIRFMNLTFNANLKEHYEQVFIELEKLN